MAKIDHVFRELERVMLVEDGRVIVSLDDWTSIQEKYASKQPKKIPSVRKRPRKNRETLAEHQALKRQLFERANGGCEGARIRRDGELVREHAPDCPRAVPLHGQWTTFAGLPGNVTDGNITAAR